MGEHPTGLGGVEEQDGSVDAEECAPAQRFHVPVLEVEGLMWSYGRKVDENLLIGSIWDRGVDGGFVVRGVCNREVGESCDADGRRLSDGIDKSDGRCRVYACL